VAEVIRAEKLTKFYGKAASDRPRNRHP